MQTLVAVVPREEGEVARRRLAAAGVLRRDRKITTREADLLIPVSEGVSFGYPIEPLDLPVRESRPHTYRDVVRVPEELRSLLPRSLDVVGGVVIVRLTEELRPFEARIGDALLQVHPSAKTVAVDEGVQGPFRQRTLRVIAGKRETRTLHREYGLTLAVDPAEVYFSPRMASERRRIAGLIQSHEVVVDAFSGVGPFALHAARAGARPVYAVDANPRAVAFLRENIRRNRADAVIALEGPIEDTLPPLRPADRFILDYPWDPLPYVRLSVDTLKEGGILHYYEILDRGERDERIETLRARLPESRSLEVRGIREVRGYSPTQAHFAFDLWIGTA
ncbi:MAG: class I SAM-dependent methyltransferase family protein [Thermoplasmata archaeon]